MADEEDKSPATIADHGNQSVIAAALVTEPAVDPTVNVSATANKTVFDTGGQITDDQVIASSQEPRDTDGSISERELVANDTNPAQVFCVEEEDGGKDLLQQRKDDSGIVLEKSPKCASQSEVCADDRPSASNDSVLSEGAVAGFVDIESDAAAPCDNTSEAKLNRSEDSMSSGLRDSLLEVVQEEEISPDIPAVRMRRVSRRMRHLRNRLASDSEDDSGDNSSSHHSSDSMDHDSDSAQSEDDMDVELEPPKDKWCPLKEIFRRERGCSNRIPSEFTFRNRCGGSVNLVQRLSSYAKLEHHDGCVNALHFNEQGTLLASGSDDLSIIVWKWIDKRMFFTFDSGHRSNVFQSKFMPYTGDTHIISCARDGQLRLAELSSTGTCKDTRRLATHRGAAHKLALLQDSSHVFYSCGEDAVVNEVDLRQDKPHKLSITKENNRKVALYSIHSNPFKSHEYCVSGRDPFIRVFDKRMGGEGDNSGLVKKYCPHNIGSGANDVQTNVTCAVYSYNGEEIVGSYNDEDIYLFDNRHSDGADAVHKYTGHRNNATVKGINFYGPKSEFIVGGSDCGNVFLWEKESEKVVQYFTGDRGGVVNVLEPHPNLPILATSGLDHDVKIWAPQAREPTKLDGLKKTMKRNKKERADERQDPAEAIDSSMFWRLMQHFRRAARQRARQDGENVSSTDSDNSENQDSDEAEEDNDDDNQNEPMQCVPS